jgi:hypothetical protein
MNVMPVRWPGEAGDEAGRDRVAAGENDRDGQVAFFAASA